MNNDFVFDFIINYECNYRCPYCWFYSQWDEVKKFNSYINKENIIKFWKSILSKYGSVKICISGGEPFINYGLIDLILELARFHFVEVMSNLSINIDYLISKLDTLNLEIIPSFHPSFADFDEFKKHILCLQDRGYVKKISYLGWPSQIPRLNYFRDEFNKMNFHFFARPFFGIYNGKEYPDRYTYEEKKIILGSTELCGDKPPMVEPIVTKGKLCHAGEKYALIQEGGKIYRCGTQKPIRPENLIMGNMLDDNFNLYDKPQPCNAEKCICNMWSFLLVGGNELQK